MGDSPIISVENLGKKYRIRHQADRPRYTALRDVIAEKANALFRWRSPLRLDRGEGQGEVSKSSQLPSCSSGQSLTSDLRPPTSGSAPSSNSHLPSPRPPTSEDFWALRDVNFEVKQGEVVGIIGRNGAGKSTLLKILSQITEPTTGRVRIRGRVASLLEVGTGFHPELTGRENIFLNGAILGMHRAEIKRKFDEIVAFAEVEKFLDTPVKRYSSGMYVRLAFAVAAHLEPEILIVDEVLAVGDAEFQKKCLGKMQDVAKGGRTVLFVSHNMAAIRTLCSRAIFLKNGELEDDGPVSSVVDAYLTQGGALASAVWERPANMTNGGAIIFTSVKAHLEGQQPKLQLVLEMCLKCIASDCPKAFVAVDLCDAVGIPLMQATPVAEPFLEMTVGHYVLKTVVELPPLVPGRYTADIWIGSHYSSTVDFIKNAVAVTIEDSPSVGRTFPHSTDHGYLVPTSRCEYERMAAS